MPKQGILSCFPDCSCIQLQPVYFDLSSQKLLMPRQKYAVCSNRQQTVLMTEYSICAARAYSLSLQRVYALAEHGSSKRGASGNVTCAAARIARYVLTRQNYPKQAFVESPKLASLHQYNPNAPAALLFHPPCSDCIMYRLFRFFFSCFRTTK